MHQQFSKSVSQRVVCASRSRLRPVVSLLGAPKGALDLGRSRQGQDSSAALVPGLVGSLASKVEAEPLGLVSGGAASLAPGVSQVKSRGLPWEPSNCAIYWQSQRFVPAASSRPFNSVVGTKRSPARPNPSVKLSTNGRPPGPSHRYGVHFLWLGPGVLPLSPAYLER